MLQAKIWLFYRMASLVLGIFAFSQVIHAHTNFGPVSGLICGAFLFFFVLYAVNKNSIVAERMFLLTSPCWPAGKYPQAYWFAFGETLSISAGVNLVFHRNNPPAVSLYVGLLLLGAGACLGALVAHYQVGRRGP
jgi:hypothetical protein